jgi:hypothetical protein
MFTRKMLVSVITGALLGVVCIVGAELRSGFAYDAPYLFSFWFNRLLMGVVIGLAVKKLGTWWTIGRGAFLGLLVSFAFYSSTGFNDVVGFTAGVVYGIIIEYTALRLGKKATGKTN